MSVAMIDASRRPGCSAGCTPRWHDLSGHERYGAEQERARARRRIVRTGPLVVNLDTEAVYVGGEQIRISPRERQLLGYLAERVGEWCLSRVIRRAVWGSDDYAHSLIYTTICRLRARLGPAADMVENDIRSGAEGRYRLRDLEAER